MRKNRLTEEQMNAIDRLLCEPTSHAIGYVPHRVMAESFLDLDAYLEEHYLPRFLDRYALVVLVLLYTWADHVRIVPGKRGRNEYPPTVIEDDGTHSSDVKDIDNLVRSTLLNEGPHTTNLYIESRGILITLRGRCDVLFFGLGPEEERLAQSLADANGLFLKRATEERTVEDCLNATSPTTYPRLGRTVSNHILPTPSEDFPDTDTLGGAKFTPQD